MVVEPRIPRIYPWGVSIPDSLIGLPACIAGLLLAYPVANRISRNLMQRLVVLIVIIGGITCIAKAF